MKTIQTIIFKAKKTYKGNTHQSDTEFISNKFPTIGEKFCYWIPNFESLGNNKNLYYTGIVTEILEHNTETICFLDDNGSEYTLY